MQRTRSQEAHRPRTREEGEREGSTSDFEPLDEISEQSGVSRQDTLRAEPARRVNRPLLHSASSSSGVLEQRGRSPSPSRSRRPATGSSVSLLTATLHLMNPPSGSSETRESTDDDAVRDIAGVRMPRRTSISRSIPPSNVSTDSEEGASTVHPRAIPMPRSPTLSRSVVAGSPEMPRRRRRGGTRGQRNGSPSSYPRSGRARRSGIESEPEDMSGATASDAFLTLLDATRDIVTFSSSTSSRAFSAPAASVAPAAAMGATARVGPSDRSSPVEYSAADLPSSLANSGTSEQPQSSPTVSSKGSPPPRPSSSGWSSWLSASLQLRVWQVIGIAGLLLGVGVFCGRSMRVLRPHS